MAKLKNWQYAYVDYKNKMHYQDIADKYNVSRSTIDAWKKRHWDDMLRQEAESQDGTSIEAQIQEEISRKTSRVQEYSKTNLPKLTDREQAFVKEYIVDFNKTAAAIRAGYAVSSAGQIAAKMYNKPNVYAHIQIALAERNRRTGVSAEIVIRELARIALADTSRAIDVDTGAVNPAATEDDLHAISSIKIKKSYDKNGKPIIEREVKMHDKVKALEMLARHIGMLNTTSTVNVNHSLDLSKLSTQELQAELERQKQISSTIDIEAISSDEASSKH